MTFRSVLYWVVVGGLLLPGARADEWNKEMLVIIKQPLQVPGTVLQPGDYTFRLNGSTSNRNIVKIYNRDQNHLYQTTQAIPNYRLRPSSKARILLEERAAGEPEAIKALFFPGDNYGQEFVYPPAAVQTAISVTQHPIVAAAKPTPPPAPAPAPALPPIQAAVPPAPAAPPAPPQVAQVPKPLPRTASDEPLIALLGGLSIAAAFGLRKLRRTP
jgi:hypothetical protein